MSDSGSENDHQLPPAVYEVGTEVEVPGTNGQLFKTVTKEGLAGAAGSCPLKGARVLVHYTGTLASNGKKFDSSRDRNEPFEFVLGKGQVIKGWDKGVATMRIGEVCNLKCLPSFAYGANGSPPTIPANSTLNFDVELISWELKDDISGPKSHVSGNAHGREFWEAIPIGRRIDAGQDGTDPHPIFLPEGCRVVMKEAFVPAADSNEVGSAGEGYDNPAYEALVTCNVRCYIATFAEDGEESRVEVFSKDGWEIVMGSVESDALPPALAHGISHMLPKERALVRVQDLSQGMMPFLPHAVAKAADEKSPVVLLQKALNAASPPIQVVYDIHVLSFTNTKPWDFKGVEKIKEALIRKNEGTKQFLAKDHYHAEKKYRRGIEFVESDFGLEDEECELLSGVGIATTKDQTLRTRLSLLGNLSQVLLNTGRYSECLQLCNKVLAADGNNLKAIFRRGKVLGLLEEFEDGIKDFTRLLDLDASNEAAKQELAYLKQRQAYLDNKQKQMFKKMFA